MERYGGVVSGITVIIPSRNAGNLTPCLAALRQHDPGLRVIVEWHTHGEYAPIEIAERDDIDTRYVREPWCFSKACNQGIETAGTDSVVLYNDDILLVTPGGISRMVEIVEADQSIGLIAPLTNVTGHGDQSSHLWLSGDRIRTARTVAFLCVLIPRRTIETVGLLDERFVTYGGEDIDYCRRVQQAGLRVAVYDGCYVDHGSLPSTFRPGSGSGDIAEGLRLLGEKWGPTWTVNLAC